MSIAVVPNPNGGLSDVLLSGDLIDAENDLRDLELEYLNLLLSFNLSRDSLSRLVGLDVEGLSP